MEKIDFIDEFVSYPCKDTENLVKDVSERRYYERLYDGDIGYILKCINEVFPPCKFKSSAGWNNSLEEWHENTSEFGDVDVVITLYKQKITGVTIDIDVRYNHTLLECAYSGKWVDIHHLKRIKEDLEDYFYYEE